MIQIFLDPKGHMKNGKKAYRKLSSSLVKPFEAQSRVFYYLLPEKPSKLFTVVPPPCCFPPSFCSPD